MKLAVSELNLYLNQPNYQTKRNKPVSFSGQRLFEVPLAKMKIDGGVEKIAGYFTKMNESDVGLVDSISHIWEPSQYGGCVVKTFKNLFKTKTSSCAPNSACYMIEAPQLESPLERVRALASVREYPSEKKLKVAFLQSASSFCMKNDIKYAGSMMLSSISRIAEAKRYEQIYLFSGSLKSDHWYNRIGFHEDLDFDSVYTLSSIDFGLFRNMIAYRIKRCLGGLPKEY